MLGDCAGDGAGRQQGSLGGGVLGPVGVWGAQGGAGKGAAGFGIGWGAGVPGWQAPGWGEDLGLQAPRVGGPPQPPALAGEGCPGAGGGPCPPTLGQGKTLSGCWGGGGDTRIPRAHGSCWSVGTACATAPMPVPRCQPVGVAPVGSLTPVSLLGPVQGSRPGKNVQLTENEIRGLCLKSREIFLSQPILLELEAPLKICGEGWTAATPAGHPGHGLGEPPGPTGASQHSPVLPQGHG